MNQADTVEWAKVIVPAAIAIAGFAIGLWQYREARRRQLLIDVQEGDKSTVAFVAMQVSNGHIPKRSTKRRVELFQALCLAAVFVKSGRSMALIHRALASASENQRYRDELRQIVDRTTVAITRSSGYTDLRDGRRRLTSLRAVLQLDGDLRMRMDAHELMASSPARDLPPESEIPWNDLERAIKQLRSLIVIAPSGRQDTIVSLAFHTHPTASGHPRSDSVSAQVIRAKYERESADVTRRLTASIADRLAAIVEAIPAYRQAALIAVVPGRCHVFSRDLGKSVATRTMKTPPLLLEGEWSSGAPHFRVPDRSLVKGKAVIVVDDVYRSGQTVQAAREALRAAGATKVLGLTATCTISAVADSAHDECATPRA